METPKPDSKLSSATEYALIFGAGATAAMSLVAQQAAAASVPVTALVAIGLLNRRRLDQRLKEGESGGPVVEEQATHQREVPAQQITAQPLPAAAPHPPMAPAPMGGRPHFAPAMGNPPQARFGGTQQRLVAAKEALQAAQMAQLQKIGAYLQQRRLEKALSLQDIQHQTYIQRYALKAIEDGDLAALPEPFYVQAFIQKYAIALGLEGSAIAAEFPTR